MKKNRRPSRLTLSRETLVNLGKGESWERNVRGGGGNSSRDIEGCPDLPDPTGCNAGNGSICP